MDTITVSFTLLFSEYIVLKDFSINALLETPVILQKNIGNSVTTIPVGIVDYVIANREGITINAQLWTRFVEDVDMNSYKAECELSEDKASFVAFVLMPKAKVAATPVLPKAVASATPDPVRQVITDEITDEEVPTPQPAPRKRRAKAHATD